MSTLYEKGTPNADGYRDVDVPAVVAEKGRLRSAGQVAARDQAIFERVLRECRDLLAVARWKAGAA
ncbi:MAG TPA: hypothetical protein VLQ93_13420 [Myxococcaceae bacterium]|nr:hypothetical protein [Myxococcaceae bacterium]